MIFAGNKNVNIAITIKIYGEVLHKTSSVTYLGDLIDRNLNWKEHVAFIHSKISRASEILHKALHLLTREALITLYYALMYPHLHYCIVI